MESKAFSHFINHRFEELKQKKYYDMQTLPQDID